MYESAVRGATRPTSKITMSQSSRHLRHGFQNVLTRSERKAVVDFAQAVNAEIIASVTTSAGVRDSGGVWTSTQAKAWLDYTNAIGGHIAAIEFMNEPTLMVLGGVSDKYGATEYGRDSKIFKEFLRKGISGNAVPGSQAAQLKAGRKHLLPTSYRRRS